MACTCFGAWLIFLSFNIVMLWGVAFEDYSKSALHESYVPQYFAYDLYNIYISFGGSSVRRLAIKS